jgi:hypothetical protein
MNRKAMCVAAAIAASFAMAGCGQGKGDGGVNVNVGVAGLMEYQHFCFTWALYQEGPQGWVLVDAMDRPLCAASGLDHLWSYASCYDGQRFIVAYEVTFYDQDNLVGTASGTSGGGANDICVKSADAETSALFQFRNEGNAGGANVSVDIDQVCTNDKAVIEHERAVSALWVQPDECTEGTPDSYCVLGSGCGLRTVRYGITADGLTRFLFNDSATTMWWSVYYLIFEPVVPPDVLILQHSPYVLNHELSMGNIQRYEQRTGVAFRYDSSAQGIGVGFINLEGEELKIVFDLTGTCNAGINLDASMQTLVAPQCPEELMLLGAIPAGGSAFTLVLQCGGGGFEFVSCDARGMPGGICATINAKHAPPAPVECSD